MLGFGRRHRGHVISGIGHYLKERNPDVKHRRRRPRGIRFSPAANRSGWKVEGIGEDFVPKTFNGQMVDDWVRISDAESFHTAREVARREGLLVGGSCGTAIAAALRYARRLTAKDLVVVVLRGHRAELPEQVLRRVKWLAANKLQWVPDDAAHRRRPAQEARRAGDHHHLPRRPAPPTPSTCFQRAGISQLPVVEAGKPVGSVQEVTLARILHDHRDPEAVAVGEIMAKPLPALDVATHLDEAYRLLLSGNTGVLAIHDGEVVGIVTRIDLIDYWTPRRKSAV